MRSDYEIIETTATYVMIKDLNKGRRSVTNDAENVVGDLLEILRGRRLFYVDSDATIDEILVKDGEFDGFAPGGPD